MNIWLIQTGEPLPLESDVKKMRTALLADEFVKRGHKVIWWSSAFDHFKKEWVAVNKEKIKINESLELIFLKGFGYRKNVSLLRFLDHRIVAKNFKKLAPKLKKPDVIIVSLPPHDLAYEAVKFANQVSAQIIVDIRDKWPDIFLEHMPFGFQWVAKGLLFKDFKMTSEAMKKATGLVAVTNGFLDWGLKYAKRRARETDMVFPLGYKNISTLNESAISDNLKKHLETFQNKFVIAYIGTISKSYHNPFILLNAAKKMKNKKDVHFVIAGDGDRHMVDNLKKESEKINNLTLTGWLNSNEIELLLRYASIGVCPATSREDLPTNKIYTYLSAGLPVISSFGGELKEVIANDSIGLYYPPNDDTCLVNCIQQLYEDKSLYQVMAVKAKSVYNNKFDANKIYAKFVDHIEFIATKN